MCVCVWERLRGQGDDALLTARCVLATVPLAPVGQNIVSTGGFSGSGIVIKIQTSLCGNI